VVVLVIKIVFGKEKKTWIWI